MPHQQGFKTFLSEKEVWIIWGIPYQLLRRFGRVYLGVVVLCVWYFEHALLQLNNCHHILPEKINPLVYLFAKPHSLHGMSQSTTIILSFHDNVWKYMHIVNADMLGAKLQHRTEVVTARRVRFISAPLILTDVFSHPSHCTVYSGY